MRGQNDGLPYGAKDDLRGGNEPSGSQLPASSNGSAVPTQRSVMRKRDAKPKGPFANCQVLYATAKGALKQSMAEVDQQTVCKCLLYAMLFDDRDFHIDDWKIVFHSATSYEKFQQLRDHRTVQAVARKLTPWTRATASYRTKTRDDDVDSEKEARRNRTPIYVGNVGNVSQGDLRRYFAQYGAVHRVDKKQLNSKKEGEKYDVAFVYFNDAAGALAALNAGIAQTISGNDVVVNRAAATQDNAFPGNAGLADLPTQKDDFRVFGTFEDHEGFLYTLNNNAFGRVGDTVTDEYLSNSAHVPHSVGDEHGLLEGLIAMEIEEDLVLKAEESGDTEAARLHRATCITIISAIDLYCLGVSLEEHPIVDRVLWVPGAQARTTRYADIKNKFQGLIHDVLFQRRGPPCFSASVGYYVVFKSADDAKKPYCIKDGIFAYTPASDDLWHNLYRLFFKRRMIEIRSKLYNAGLCSRSWRHSKYWGDRAYATRLRLQSQMDPSAHSSAAGATASELDGVAEEEDTSHGIAGIQQEHLPAVDAIDVDHTEQVHADVEYTSPGSAVGSHAEPVEADKEGGDAVQAQQFLEDMQVPSDPGSRAQEITDSYAAHIAERAKNRDTQQFARPRNVPVATGGVIRHICYALYQLFDDKSFLDHPGIDHGPNSGYMNRKVKPCQGVSYGYVIRECDTLYERNELRNGPAILHLLQCVDEWYDTREMLGIDMTLSEIWWNLHYDDPRRQDDGLVLGIGAANALTLPPEFEVHRVHTAAEMQELLAHLTSLTDSFDAIGLDTEGGDQFETLQIGTTRNGAYVLDMRDCRKYPALLQQIAEAIKTSRTLRFGQDWSSDAGSFDRLSTSPGSAVVHDIREFVLKVFGVSHDAYYSPSLSSFTEMVLGKHLPKDCQLSNWHARPLTRRQYRYAVLDAVVLIMIVQKCHRKFPIRFSKEWTRFSKLGRSTGYSHKNSNGVCPGLFEQDDPAPLTV